MGYNEILFKLAIELFCAHMVLRRGLDWGSPHVRRFQKEHSSLQGKCHTHSGRVGPEDPSRPFPQLDGDLRGAQP